MSQVGWRECPVPRQPWEVRRAWASIVKVVEREFECGGEILSIRKILGNLSMVGKTTVAGCQLEMDVSGRHYSRASLKLFYPSSRPSSI